MTVIENERAGINDHVHRLVNAIDKYDQLFAGLSAQDIERIERIFVRNYMSGRAYRVMAHGQTYSYAQALRIPSALSGTDLAEHTLAEWQFMYLQKVVMIYRQESVRMQALADGNPTVWDALSRHLFHSAYKLLLRKGINGASASELAPDMAQQTCIQIYTSTFPCDVAFDTWAHVILKNQILHRLTRSRDLLDRQRHIESLEGLQAELEDHHLLVPVSQFPNQAGLAALLNPGQIENADWLDAAIAQIPSAERRVVIIYTFYHMLSDEEIALELGKSKGAVHTLRHRALKQLQNILNKTFEPPT